MALISDEEREEIRSRADIVQVIGERIPLKKSGQNFKGLCPFHAEKTPSFMVHPEKQIYHCFGCGEGGDLFSFLMKHDGIDFVEAVDKLAERYGVVLKKEKPGEKVARGEKDLFYRVNRLAFRFFYDSLVGDSSDREGQRGREYLEKRGIRITQEGVLGYAPRDGKALVRRLQEKKVPLELAQKAGLIRQGAAGDWIDFFRDRLIFGVVSADGKILGFTGRVIADEAQPKYLNSPDSLIYHKGETFLGLQVARQAIRDTDQAILVEGNFDLIRLHQEGIKNVVAPLGTALTDRQARVLKRLTENFVVIFDGDEAGRRAAERALELLLPLGVLPRVVLLPSGEDPDSFVKSKGPEALQNLISSSPSLLDVSIEHILRSEGKDAQGKGKALRKIAGLIAKIPGEIEKTLSLQRVADRHGLPEAVLRSEGRNIARSLSNFSAGSVDVGDVKEVPLPPIERTILEVLVSGEVNPESLFEQIGEHDFSHRTLGEIWIRLKEDYQRHGKIDLNRVLSGFGSGFGASSAEEATRRLLSEIAFAPGRWRVEPGKVAADCIRQFRASRFKGKLKDLSQEIQQAEVDHNISKRGELLDEKNRLIKEMTRLH